VRTCSRLQWPVRTLSFSHDGAFCASGSEDQHIEIFDVATGETAHALPTSAPMNSVAWHPSRLLLAYAGDDKDRTGRDEGSLRIFGFSS
jgi:THO complex subunit 3